MNIIFERNDISKVTSDVIVNLACPEFRIANHGIDSSICNSAGKEKVLKERLKTFKRLLMGEIGITGAYNLKAKYIFHVLNPAKNNSCRQVVEKVKNIYEQCLKKADEKDCKSIAFPIIGAGYNVISYDLATYIAYETCKNYLIDNSKDIQVKFVFFGTQIENFIKMQKYNLSIVTNDKLEKQIINEQFKSIKSDIPSLGCDLSQDKDISNENIQYENYHDNFIKTFNKFYKQVNTQLNNVDIYNRAALSKSTFSMIKNGKIEGLPTKENIIALIFGMKLSKSDGIELLNSAGIFVDIEKCKFDNIVFSMLEQHKDVDELNYALKDNGFSIIIGSDGRKEKTSSQPKTNKNKPLYR